MLNYEPIDEIITIMIGTRNFMIAKRPSIYFEGSLLFFHERRNPNPFWFLWLRGHCDDAIAEIILF